MDYINNTHSIPGWFSPPNLSRVKGTVMQALAIFERWSMKNKRRYPIFWVRTGSQIFPWLAIVVLCAITAILPQVPPGPFLLGTAMPSFIVWMATSSILGGMWYTVLQWLLLQRLSPWSFTLQQHCLLSDWSLQRTSSAVVRVATANHLSLYTISMCSLHLS